MNIEENKMNIEENKFGLKQFTKEKLKKLEEIPSNLLKLLKSYRGYDDIDNLIDPNKYYLYTGRGTSNNSFHIGHLLGLKLILGLQKVFTDKIYFMISDDEKIFRDNIDELTMQNNVANTIKQLNKLGFNNLNTNIHINSNGIDKHSYSIIIKIMRILNVDLLNNIFGAKSNIGELFYVAYQIMPCFIDKNKQCIVVAGEDQDPFFRLARDIAHKLKCKPPIVLYTINFPGLDGSNKMSTSVPETIPIFIEDTPKIIKQKVSKIKQVGAGTLDELFDKGANLMKDVPFKLIEFLETNSEILSLIRIAYTEGLFQKDLDKISQLLEILPSKGVITRNNKTMITTYGVRSYLANLMITEIQK
jgi:tryptophanyl-tRNA synthetase